MAIYVKGALGSFSGKLGNIVGSNWRSIDYLRSLPKPSKKAATAKQIAHRAKFALVADFLNPLRGFINMGYNDPKQQKMTAFNRATSHLLTKIEGQYPDFIIPYDEVKLSKGSLKSIAPLVTMNLDGDLEIIWDPTVNPLSSEADDLVYFVMYNEATKDYFLYQDSIREDGEDIINPGLIMKAKLLTLLIVSILFFSCGTLYKKQNLHQSVQNTESLSLENQDSHISHEVSQWLQSQMQQLHYTTTLIHSDSTITYQPDNGFQLSKGTIMLSKLKQQATTSQETISSREQESNHSRSNQELNVHQEQSNKQSEKERLPTIPPLWLALFCIIAILSPLLLAYMNKKNKR